MVSGRKCRPRSLYRLIDLSDNASRGTVPTSVLNHETSDHLLSRCWAICAAFSGCWTDDACAFDLDLNVIHSGNNNKSCM